MGVPRREVAPPGGAQAHQDPQAELPERPAPGDGEPPGVAPENLVEPCLQRVAAFRQQTLRMAVWGVAERERFE